MKTTDNDSELFDVVGLLRFYLSKWYWFAGSVLVCCLLAYGVSKLVKPKYMVSSSMFIEADGGNSLLKAGMGGMSELLGGSSSADDEALIMRSHSVFRSVARQLGLDRRHTLRVMPLVHRFLYQEYPVEVTPDDAINLDTLTTVLRFRVAVEKDHTASVKVTDSDNNEIAYNGHLTLPAVMDTPYGKFTVSLTEYMPKDKSLVTSIWLSNLDDAAEYAAQDLTIGAATKNSNLITFETVTPYTTYAKDLLNSVMNTYIDFDVQQQIERSAKTSESMNDRIKQLFGDLTSAEGNLEQYKEERGLRDVAADGAYAYGKLASLEARYLQGNMELETLEGVIELLNSASDTLQLLPVVENASGLIGEYNRLVMSRLRMSSSAHPDNRVLRLMDQQLEQLRSNLMATLNNSLERGRDLVKDYYSRYERVEGELSTIPTRERELRNLTRQQRIKEEIYMYLLKKQEENAILMASTMAKARIVDMAHANSRNQGMKLTTLLIMAFVFGLMIPPVWFYVRDIMASFRKVEQKTDEAVNPQN